MKKSQIFVSDFVSGVISLIAVAVMISGCSHHGTSGALPPDNKELDQGGDAVSFGDQAAWFTGTQKIKYCMFGMDGSKIYAQDAGVNSFGMSATQAQTALLEAAQMWVDYAKANEVKTTVDMTFDAMEPACDGHQDLTIFLGEVHPGNIGWVGTPNRLSLAVRTKYDPVANWGGGFIWLAVPGTPLTKNDPKNTAVVPAWTPETLRAVLAHELGHVFGITHAPDTLMDENLNALVLTPAQSGESIDGFHDLLFAPSVKGSLGSDPKVNFKRLTGKDPVGDVIATIVTTQAAPATSPTYSLVVSDAQGSHPPFQLQAVQPPLAEGAAPAAAAPVAAPVPAPVATPVPLTIAVFATATRVGDQMVTSSVERPAETSSFVLTTASGSALNVVLTRNIDTAMTTGSAMAQASGVVLKTDAANPDILFAEHVRAAPASAAPGPTK